MAKKTAVIFFLILCVVICGCGKDRYSIEKRYYHTLRQANSVFKNPHATPPNELQKVVSLLNNFSQEFPKSKLAVNAEFNIARLYTVKAEYKAARAQLMKITANYVKSKPICSEAAFLTGNTYELENKWPVALAQYKKIIQDYPVTSKGINTPLYIIQYYKKNFEPDKMKEATRDAIKHYNGLAEKYPDSPLEIRVQTLAAECYILLQEPQSSIDTLNRLIEKYKDKINTDGIVMSIALIYSREMKDKAKTKLTLERLIKDYPKSKLVQQAKDILKNI